MTWLVGGLGALFGLGMFLSAAGLRGGPSTSDKSRRPRFGRSNRQDFLLRTALALVCGLAVALPTGWLAASLLSAALGAFGPTMFGGRAARRRQLERIEAIAAWTEMLRDVSASGAGIQGAVAATVPVAPEPIRPQLEALAVRLERDRLVPALRRFADDVGDPLADLVVAALITASAEQTRRFGDLLSSLASAIREHAAMRLRIESGRARVRATAQAVAAISIASSAGFVAFDRGFLAPYDSLLGQLVLLVIGGCFVGAFYLLGRLGRSVDPPRLLMQEAAEMGT